MQGTTYTTLAFLETGVPIISHFGSTTVGFLRNVPSLNNLKKEGKELAKIFTNLKVHNVFDRPNPSLCALQDIGQIEHYVAQKSDVVVVTSEQVKKELIEEGSLIPVGMRVFV